MSDAQLEVLHTVASTRARHGGPSRSVPSLCEALAERNASVRLVTTMPAPNQAATPLLPTDPVETRTVDEGQGLFRQLRAVVPFYRALHEEAKTTPSALMHDHGVWLPTNVAAALVAWTQSVPLVISTRGMLTDWALQHNRWKKRLAWWAYQKHALGQAALFHVTSQEEVDVLRDLGFEQPAAIIPNGVSLPERSRPSEPSQTERRVLFLSRIHPKKGLPMLIDAWAEVEPEHWVLELVGPSEGGHREELERQVEKLGLGETVRFGGPVSDDEKWDVYRRADLFVLPTHSENFGIVVAEALAAGVPVITTTGAPWADLEARDCGWWVEPSSESIADALDRAIALSDAERTEMGRRGRQLVEDRYSWSGVADKMMAAYRWLQGEGARPDFIQHA